MTGEEMVQAWCRKNWGDGEYTVEVETLSDGYCETCYSEYGAVVVRKKDYKTGRRRYGENIMAEYRDMSIVDLLNQILEANKEIA